MTGSSTVRSRVSIPEMHFEMEILITLVDLAI